MSSISPSSLPNGYAACHAVVGDAINRCRWSNKLSRVTIVVKHLENNAPSLLTSFEVLVSDTGDGISSEEILQLFQSFPSTHLTHLCTAPLFWGGDLTMMTTESMENEVRQYHIGDAFNRARIMQLRSVPKKSGTYSGTNITLDFKGYPEQLLLYVCDMCCKIKILMLKSVVIEVCIARLTSNGPTCEDVLLLSEGITLPAELSNLERLSIGLAIHDSEVLDAEKPMLSSPERNLHKIGKGLAGSSETTETLWAFEACFAVKEAVDNGKTCLNTERVETMVLFFQDFIGASMTPTIVNALKTKVNWDNFGLKVKNIQLDTFGRAIIEWEDSSRLSSIELVLHKYRSTQVKAPTWSREVVLLKKCVEEALNDLKNQNPHLFLSHWSAQLQNYVPDLSNCISRLISSSSDVIFKGSCAKILGLESTDFEVVELCLRAKLLQVIEDSDRQPQKITRKDKDRDSVTYGTQESTCLEEDEEEGYDDDCLEGSSIWEYL